MEDSIMQVIENLATLEGEASIPKNVKGKIRGAIELLRNSEKNIGLRVDQSLETLGDICDDPNLQPYVRMQLWSIVSKLESK